MKRSTFTTAKEFLTGKTVHVHNGVVYHPDWGGHCLGCFDDEEDREQGDES